ncbi:hypothetical protein SADUNF_Sadunf02G0200000 [Salix dunnii]|uniref:Uncharacterized protein n=1 Tax=Salix dunnii TaxID=1413687 RepID=A0A835N8V5_9ROSI|nr:hypothetical protein SADUNF_Sadunf02G0200000 [Salix dunnii]
MSKNELAPEHVYIPVVLLVYASGEGQDSADMDQQNLGFVAGLDSVDLVSLTSDLPGWLVGLWMDQERGWGTHERVAQGT